MTTEAGRRFPALGAAVALAAWFGGMTLAALVVEPASVIAFGPPARLLAAALDADAAFLDTGRAFVALRTGGAGTVRRLYAGGAWLVWPALGAGCGGGTPGTGPARARASS